jgi:phosphohistidine phosphatase SixA
MAKSIDVTFIRHAESEDNLKVKALCEVLVGFRKGKLPSFQQLLLVLGLLEYDIDSNLSQHGKRQASDMSMILKTKGFWDRPIDCIVYSPLIRATETCMTIRPSNVQDRCICLEELREITPFEQLSKAKVDQKVAVFEKWLLTRAGDVSHVVVVGHCQCFNNLLGMKTLMRNCDVWRSSVTFSEEETGASTTLSGRVGAWAAPQLLHRSALSQPHPIGKVFQGIPALEGWSGWGPEDAQESVQEDGEEDEDGGELDAQRRAARDNDEVEDDLTNEPVCRICQVQYVDCTYFID